MASLQYRMQEKKIEWLYINLMHYQDYHADIINYRINEVLNSDLKVVNLAAVWNLPKFKRGYLKWRLSINYQQLNDPLKGLISRYEIALHQAEEITSGLAAHKIHELALTFCYEEARPSVLIKDNDWVPLTLMSHPAAKVQPQIKDDFKDFVITLCKKFYSWLRKIIPRLPNTLDKLVLDLNELTRERALTILFTDIKWPEHCNQKLIISIKSKNVGIETRSLAQWKEVVRTYQQSHASSSSQPSRPSTPNNSLHQSSSSQPSLMSPSNKTIIGFQQMINFAKEGVTAFSLLSKTVDEQQKAINSLQQALQKSQEEVQALKEENNRLKNDTQELEAAKGLSLLLTSPAGTFKPPKPQQSSGKEEKEVSNDQGNKRAKKKPRTETLSSQR